MDVMIATVIPCSFSSSTDRETTRGQEKFVEDLVPAGAEDTRANGGSERESILSRSQ